MTLRQARTSESAGTESADPDTGVTVTGVRETRLPEPGEAEVGGAHFSGPARPAPSTIIEKLGAERLALLWIVAEPAREIETGIFDALERFGLIPYSAAFDRQEGKASFAFLVGAYDAHRDPVEALSAIPGVMAVSLVEGADPVETCFAVATDKAIVSALFQPLFKSACASQD